MSRPTDNLYNAMDNDDLYDMPPKTIAEARAALRAFEDNKPNAKQFEATDYVKLGQEIGALVARKQREYGDSFGRAGAVLRCLFPRGIEPGRYDDVLCLARIIDKLFRIATDEDMDQEDPFADVCGYALLGAARRRMRQKRGEDG